jgi:hypothetical protein
MSGNLYLGCFKTFLTTTFLTLTLVFGMCLMLLIWMECFIMQMSSIKTFLTGIHQK